MDQSERSNQFQIGTTYSRRYAAFMGLDSRESYRAILNELGIRFIRLPVYWDEIEIKPGTFNWKDLDWQIEEGEKKNVNILLAFGHRAPRWPECYAPSWTHQLSNGQFANALLNTLGKVIDHFAPYKNIEAWQVENEPFAVKYNYGIECRDITQILSKEISLVHALDAKMRPVVITYPHLPRFAPWWKIALDYGDIAGIDIYTRIWFNRYFYYGYIEPLKLEPLILPSLKYHRSLAESKSKQLWVTELQAEPWGPRLAPKLTREESYSSIDPQRLLKNIKYVYKSGISRVYLWGIEWWLFERDKNENNIMWEAGKALMNPSQFWF